LGGLFVDIVSNGELGAACLVLCHGDFGVQVV
jgi:hypothetical protein